LEYDIKWVKDSKEGLKLNGKHQLLAYADNFSTVGENIDHIKKNIETLSQASKEDGLEVYPQKTKYTLLSHYQKLRQKYSTKIANRSFEDVAKFRYSGTTLTDQNCIPEEIKSRINSGNACYHSLQSPLSSRLLYRNVKVKIYRTIILPVALYGRET
jgi:hypothetical protein